MIGTEPQQRECSRAGCRNEAIFRIEWRNPRIHSVDRVKVWVACDEHVDFLREFLGARDFPLTVLMMNPEQAGPLLGQSAEHP